MHHETVLNTQPLGQNAQVPFRCQKCADCCRNVTKTIMVEALDAYRIARHLRAQGYGDMDMSMFYNQYTEPSLLGPGYPIFLMKTDGNQDCLFLQDGRCTIYAARPRICRLYPFTVSPGARGRDFCWELCLDRPSHLKGGIVRAKDWFYENFKKEDRQFLKQEYDSLPTISKLLKDISEPSALKQAVFHITHYRYFAFDLSAPFLPQYIRNTEFLLTSLQGIRDKCGHESADTAEERPENE